MTGFCGDTFVITLVDADLLLGKYADELGFNIKILAELDDFEAVPKSPDILGHMMVRVNRILGNEKFMGMRESFVIRNTVTQEILAKGYSLDKGNKNPISCFKRCVDARLPIEISYDY